MRRARRLPQPSRRAWTALALLALGIAPAGPLMAQGVAPPANGPIWNGRQDQPSRDGTESRLQEENAARSPRREQEQLRELNALSRQLHPGAEVPAPEVEGRQERR